MSVISVSWKCITSFFGFWSPSWSSLQFHVIWASRGYYPLSLSSSGPNGVSQALFLTEGPQPQVDLRFMLQSILPRFSVHNFCYFWFTCNWTVLVIFLRLWESHWKTMLAESIGHHQFYKLKSGNGFKE